MSERFSVSVNGKPVEVHRGMKIKHALIAFDPALYDDCRKGRTAVRDENGFIVGLEGALHEGARLTAERVQEEP